MKKRIVILVALMAVLLLVAGPVYATPPKPVVGTLTYIPTAPPVEREANGNTFVSSEDHEEWIGDFEGTADAPFRVVQHSLGFAYVWYRSPFVGTVLGSEPGEMVIQIVGKKPAVGDWYGRWVILSGKDGLENIRGQGIWGGPGWDINDPGIPGDIWYEGNIRFKPVK